MNQAQVQEIYLRVIDATIEGVRAEFAEKGASDATLDSFALLKERWATRYTHTHDFTDDPSIIDKPAASAKGARKLNKSHAKQSSKKSPPKNQNGVIPVAALTNGPEEYKDPSLPSIPRNPSSKQEPRPEVIEVKDDEPPLKRQRVVIDDKDDNDINKNEDLDSSDSEKSSESDDEIAENLVLAQHDRVKKGNPKWKVIMKEGIVNIRGREYLFNKATCDLDF